MQISTLVRHLLDKNKMRVFNVYTNTESFPVYFNILDSENNKNVVKCKDYLGRITIDFSPEYIKKSVDQLGLNLEKTLKTLVTIQLLHINMGLYTNSENYKNKKILQLAQELEINWNLNLRSNNFKRADDFNLQEYKDFDYYYKKIEELIKDRNDFNDYKSEENESEENESEENDQSGSDSEKSSNELSDKGKLTRQLLNNEFDKNRDNYKPSDICIEGEVTIENYDKEMDFYKKDLQRSFTSMDRKLSKDNKKAGQLNNPKLKQIINKLLRDERQINITQTRKQESYMKYNNRRKSDFIMPGKKIVKSGAVKKFDTQLTVFIDVSGSTNTIVKRTDNYERIVFNDLLNRIAFEFHKVGANIVYYNTSILYVLKESESFQSMPACGGTWIQKVVEEYIENYDKNLQRVIIFTDGADNFDETYDNYDTQIYKVDIPDTLSQDDFSVEYWKNNTEQFVKID